MYHIVHSEHIILLQARLLKEGQAHRRDSPSHRASPRDRKRSRSESLPDQRMSSCRSSMEAMTSFRADVGCSSGHSHVSALGPMPSQDFSCVLGNEKNNVTLTQVISSLPKAVFDPLRAWALWRPLLSVWR
ncbi:hypothetical protein WJX75_001094 [Coccomyxa subellipsoidea]|uniref:Uncharacterized protein n=1 Tax=Coccomyxa subellipsoidea TaxID=248742 RepID=A0ABR2YCN8_9CHLO